MTTTNHAPSALRSCWQRGPNGRLEVRWIARRWTQGVGDAVKSCADAHAATQLKAAFKRSTDALILDAVNSALIAEQV